MAIEKIVESNAGILGLLLDKCPIVDYSNEETDLLHFDVNKRLVQFGFMKSETARHLFERNLERVLGDKEADTAILANNLEFLDSIRDKADGLFADMLDVTQMKYLGREASELVAEATID